MSTDTDDLQLVNLELSLFDKPVYQTTHTKQFKEIKHLDNSKTATDVATPLFFTIKRNAGIYVSLRECKLNLTRYFQIRCRCGNCLRCQ